MVSTRNGKRAGHGSPLATSKARVTAVSVDPAAIKDRRLASPVSASGQADRRVPIQAPLAPVAGTAARLRAEVMPPPARTGTDTASKTASSNGRVAEPGLAVPAPLGTARDHDVHSRVDRLARALRVVNLCGNFGVMRRGDSRPVGAETDRDQRGSCRQGVLEQPLFVAHHPVSTSPMPNRPSMLAVKLAQLVASLSLFATLPMPTVPRPPAALTAVASRPPATPPIGALTIGTRGPNCRDQGVDSTALNMIAKECFSTRSG